MKKRIAFALAMMMILTSLAACGGKKDDGGVSSSGAGSSSVGASSSEVDGTVSTPEAPDASVQPEDLTDKQDPAASAGQNGAAQDTGKTETVKPDSKPQQPAKPQQPSKPQQPAKPQQKPETKPEPKPEPKPEAPAEKNPAVADVAAAVEGALSVEMSFMELTADDLSALYGLSASAVEGFQCKVPMMNVQATEYFVAKAASGQVETVKAAALKRQADLVATWKQYLPEQYELVKNYKLAVNGNYVLFVVGENAQAAVDAFNNLTK